MRFGDRSYTAAIRRSLLHCRDSEIAATSSRLGIHSCFAGASTRFRDGSYIIAPGVFTPALQGRACDSEIAATSSRPGYSLLLCRGEHAIRRSLLHHRARGIHSCFAGESMRFGDRCYIIAPGVFTPALQGRACDSEIAPTSSRPGYPPLLCRDKYLMRKNRSRN